MNPSKPEDGAVVDLVDVVLRDGAVLQADVIVTVADIPLIGLKLRAALAGMDTMTEYGIFEDWDAAHRRRALDDARRSAAVEAENDSVEAENHSTDDRADADDEE